MRLLIISNMAHYLKDDRVVGWGPTAQEISHLASLFDGVRHIACMHRGPAPASALPYTSDRVTLVPLPPAGGRRAMDKLGILRQTGLYVRTILAELPRADVVHVRCPANIPLLATAILSCVRAPRYRWIKYAGNWRPDGREAWSYTLQRWLLERNAHRGVVTVNGRWPGQPGHVYSFLNPSLAESEVAAARASASGKELSAPYYLLYAGAVNRAKGVGRVLRIAQELRRRGVPFELHVVGDGPERAGFEAWARDAGLGSAVTFHGWLPRPALAEYYARAHFFVFPSSSSEGWPKVLSEAMAYGAVPITSAISSIPQILADIGAGRALPPDDTGAYADAILHYTEHRDSWRAESRAGQAAATKFTYEHYLAAVSRMFRQAWGVSLPIQRIEVARA